MERWVLLFKQMVKFSLVGALNTLLDFAVFTLLTMLPLFTQNPVPAHVISYSCGVVCSLILNKLWTFRYKGRMTGRQLGIFLLVNLLALGVSSGVMALLEQWAQLHPIIEKAITLPFSMGINFLGNKLFVFKDRGTTGEL